MFPGFLWHHRRRGSFFEKGALKFIILDILAERPRHGYEVMNALEEKSGGFYSPSAGAIYPVLQMLEDLDYVRVSKENGKKVYELTEAGKSYLEKHKAKIKEHREKIAHFCSEAGEGFSLMFELKTVFQLVAESVRRSHGKPEKLAAIREVLKRTKKEIDKLMAE